jgi:hypothetical protein
MLLSNRCATGGEICRITQNRQKMTKISGANLLNLFYPAKKAWDWAKIALPLAGHGTSGSRTERTHDR